MPSLRCLAIGMIALSPLGVFAQYAPPAGGQGATLYGRLDGSVNSVKYSGESGTRKALSSDTSYFGVRGSEDLGDGLRAYFKLEGGFGLDTGVQANPTTFFNRETFVGLRNDTLGAIELGSHWSPFLYVTQKTDPFARAQTGGLLTLMQGAGVRGYTVLLTNTVLWASPDWAGFVVRAQVAAPEGTGINKNYAGSVEYARGRLYAGLALDSIQALRTAVGLSGTGAARARTSGFGVAYRFDFARLSLYAQQNRTENLPNVTGYQLGAAVPIGVSELRFAWQHSSQVGSSASLASIGYTYNLSKRTLLYTTASKLDNGSTTKFAMFPTSQDFAASPPKLGQDLTGIQIGMRHLF